MHGYFSCTVFACGVKNGMSFCMVACAVACFVACVCHIYVLETGNFQSLYRNYDLFVIGMLFKKREDAVEWVPLNFSMKRVVDILSELVL